MKKQLFFAISLFALFGVGCAPTPATESTPSPTPILITPSPTPILAPTELPFTPVVEIVGEPEVVYLWETDRCGDFFPIIDLPARAIRRADGQILLYASSTTNFHFVGNDFDSLTIDCNPILISDFDRDPANYSYAEWMGAPYTLDGETVYAIIHQEYHGDQAGSTWQQKPDFSGEQGQNQWTYASTNGSTLRKMTYRSSDRAWVGTQPLCLIGAGWMHPAIGCDPLLSWTSPIDGLVLLSGQVYDQDSNGGDGVIVTVLKGEEVLWEQTIDNGDATRYTLDIPVEVTKGDELFFRVNMRGNANNDSTYFNPGINLGPPPCPSDRHDMCTLISLTHAVSTDGGASFTQPETPDHLIANFPLAYDPDWMRSVWQPSNIVQHPEDGYYYALIQIDEHNADYTVNVQGMCVIRTITLDDPTSWRAWDGEGFNMRFINPYLEPDADPADHTCTVLPTDFGALTYGLTYNMYYEQFVAVGVGFEGFYFALSEDLIHWSPRYFIMEAAQTFAPDSEPPFYPYPTFIDHNSPSISFDVTGQTAYLYFMRQHESRAAINTDLMRVEIKFTKE